MRKRRTTGTVIVVTTRRDGSVVIWEQSSALTVDDEDEEVKPVLLVSFWGREGDSDSLEREYGTVGCWFEEDGCKCLLCSSRATHPSYGRFPSSPTPAPMLFQA